MGRKKRNPKLLIWIVSSIVALSFVGFGVLIVKMLISDDGGKRKRQIQQIQVLKPPPPPKIKEEPPPPEVKKNEEIIEPEPEEQPEETPDDSDDQPPPGEDLGLDADGTAGSDSFGLKAKKGGRALIGSGLGRRSLLAKYAYYTGVLEEEIRKRVNEILEKNGGIPDGQLTTRVRLTLDDIGNIVDFHIYGSSGKPAMDDAVKEALSSVRLDDPPPAEMPKTMKLEIKAKG